MSFDLVWPLELLQQLLLLRGDLFSPKAVENRVAPERKPRHKKKTIFCLPLVFRCFDGQTAIYGGYHLGVALSHKQSHDKNDSLCILGVGIFSPV